MCPSWLSKILNPPGATPPKAKIELYADKAQYSLGEQVTGKIKVASDEEFVVNQVLVRLRCIESIKKTKTWSSQFGTQQSEYWDRAEICNGSCKVFGSSTIPQGFGATYNYVIGISFAAQQTLYSIDHNVKWMLSAVMESVGRPFVQTQEYEIQVANPQLSQNSPAIMKEVTREVVLIPCSYCAGLMPQTSLFCPNCGARRKG
jgi:hypothetical protein